MSSRCSLLLLLLLLLPALAVAQGDGSAVSAGPPALGGALMQTFAGLLLIVVLIFLLGWLFRRFGKLPMAGKGEVKVLGGVSLGPRERAVLLQVEQTRLLVGVAPGRVQTLHVLASQPAAESDPFDQHLTGELNREAS